MGAYPPLVFRLVSALVACSLILSACAADDPLASGDAVVPEGSVTIQIERPTRADMPYDETPEEARANMPCPSDLPVDHITPVGEPAIALVHVANVPEATSLAFAPDGSAFVGTRSGSIFKWVEGSRPKIALDLTDVTTTDRDQGLLGLTVANGYLLVNRTDLDDDTVIEAYPLVYGAPEMSAMIELMRADQPSREHDGGDLTLGPDGDLYLTVGDGGAQGGPFVTGNQEAHAFGSLLRFELTFDPTPALSAAPENPFIGSTPGSDYTWVWGLRHPFRTSFDAATGDLWIADVGQQCVEEVTMLPGGGVGGEHLGWNAFQGNLPFIDQPIGPHVPPTFSYAHRSRFCAVIGGHVYRGNALPDLAGKYVFGDLCRQAIISFDPETGELQELERGTVTPVGFVFGPGGTLFVVDINQGIWRVETATAE